MSARVICKDNNLKGARQFPDIVIDCPDGILFDDKMNVEIVQVTNEDHYNALKSILKTEMRSVKSSEPIFAVVSKNNTTTDSVTSLQDYVKVVRQLLDCDLK